jgi:ribose 5-phosphate isomerase B
MKWFAGSDHAGYQLKNQLVDELRALGDEVVDCGAVNGDDSVDYPDFAVEVGRQVAGSGGDALGLLVCGTGIGIAMAANKMPGVRAAVVTDSFTAKATRSHNDANVICMGQRVIGAGVASEALRAFRDTPFEGGRHQRRVEKIRAAEGGEG